jgi:cytochrome c-type biogenesis protein CcmH/NrfG
MEESEKQMIELHGALKEFLQQNRFALAVKLARARQYLEAEGLLSPNGRTPSDPKELELLARIAAQQRQFNRAHRLWDEALLLSPNNSDYQRAIQLTEEAERGQRIRRKAVTIALAVVATAVLVFAVVNFLGRQDPAPKQTPKGNEAPSVAKPQPVTPHKQ